jgi:site-specific DNA-cytosine methylase
VAYNVNFCDSNGTRKDRPNGGLYVNETDKSNTLSSSGDGNTMLASFGVRRLTPTECERLQGFPDGWTAGFADTVRYRMLGNAVAVPVAEWIGKRIMETP